MADVIEGLREQLVQAAGMLFTAGVMQHSGHANMSARLDDERMLLTRRGVIRGLVTADVAVVPFDGVAFDGALEPTTAEIVAMHAGVYRERPAVGAIIHTHSPYVTAFAVAHAPLPCAYEALLRFGVTESIPVAVWAPRGSRESVTNIMEQIRAHPDVPAVLLANHGVLAFGRDPLESAQLIVVLEEAAAATVRARVLGGEQGFPEGALERVHERMHRFGSAR